MKKIAVYLGAVLAACLSLFSVSAIAESMGKGCEVARCLFAEAGAHGAKMRYHELTLSQWRSGDDTPVASTSSGIRADSNHFVMHAKPKDAYDDWPYVAIG